MFKNLIVAAAYAYFHYRYFALVTHILQQPRMRKRHIAGAFFLNYLLFYACSILELNLILNWALFFLLLLLETLPYCQNSWRNALFFSLSGILYGLSINIFCRCVVAIVIDQPLIAFDNNISSVGNYKSIPIALGFLLGGAALHTMTLPKSVQQLRAFIAHPAHLSFQLELMCGMFLYLFLNLLLYESRDGGVLLKLWGIKSCVFSIAGFYLGLRYSLKMCRLSDYREQNSLIQWELAQSEQKEAHLRTLAYRDVLTESYNRQYALDRLAAMLSQHVRFTLCFLDLDGLKEVNDCHGHVQGDRYLVAAAKALSRACREDHDLLARYGGDEFLLLFPDAGADTVEKRIRQVDQTLRDMSHSEAFPFSMSLSFGTEESTGYDDAAALLAAADEKMYRRKREKASQQQGQTPPPGTR